MNPLAAFDHEEEVLILLLGKIQGTIEQKNRSIAESGLGLRSQKLYEGYDQLHRASSNMEALKRALFFELDYIR
ncbi:hypothetical protein [Leptospira barantonii]|uniref:Flagellar protein FlgN n=1 Tax=Leptospira barantonii TaxID=2023184 RepID=A0ABX4NN88_9LEPT|nr:hypothetical protein [Leptospira barantonii]PJZ58294.1 hypothetical protein CH367_07915 [Leptospira barantonii]